MDKTLPGLPTDIVILVLSALNIRELAALSETCSIMHTLVSEFGWTSYARRHPRPSYSLFHSRKKWNPRTQVKYDCLTDKGWKNTKFIARPLSRTWAGKQQPTLAISPSRLIVAAGCALFSYTLGCNAHASPSISLEGTIILNGPHVHGRNITSVSFLEDGGLDQTLLVAYQEHLVEVITLVPTVQNGRHTLTFRRTHHPSFPKDDYIEGFSRSGHHLLSISSNGTGILVPQNDWNTLPTAVADSPSPTYSPTTNKIELAERSWSCHLSMDASTPFAAFGASGKTPLTVHSISQDRLSPTPYAVLHTQKDLTGDVSIEMLSSSAVYGITRAPLSSPLGSSPQVLVSGWFDGQVRIYDLRSSESSARAVVPAGGAGSGIHTNGSSDKAQTPKTFLRPVLSMTDRWSYESIYAVACGGGSSSHIAAGTARHSVVAFWDIRSPKQGWSVHAPGNDPSPVFSVILESSRFFGATESRPFVYDFGPDPSLDAYPPLSPLPAPTHTRGRSREGLKYSAGLMTYDVVKYTHASTGLLCSGR